MIEKGADINAVDLSGQTLLFDKISSINAIEFREFMEIGVNINKQDTRGYTILHEAIIQRKANLLGGVFFTDFMISHGADPTLKTNDGKTAIELAELHGRTELFSHFLNPSQGDQQSPPTEVSEVEEDMYEIEIDSDAHNNDEELDQFLEYNEERIQAIFRRLGRVRIGRRRGRLYIVDE